MNETGSNAALIRARKIVCRINGRESAEVVTDGAIYQRDGKIVEIGPWSELSARYPGVRVIGSDRHVAVPGFVNGHHHVGVTPFQLGSPDLPLELWLGHRIRSRGVDLRLDTLYSALEMLASGVTTVQHLHGRVPPPLDNILAGAERVIGAYQEIGMRVSYSYGVRDQNRLAYEADEAFAARLAAADRARFSRWLQGQQVPLADSLAVFETLRSRFADNDRVAIQLAPVNLHWCSDAALEKVAEASALHDAPMHMHLLETRYQQAYAQRRTGGSPVAHLGRLGLLGPRLTLGHGVWLTEPDIDLLAETGTRLCTNASSNLRLRSGIAPLNRLSRAGVPIALGIDEAGLNDDRDMLQEMRLVLKLHRVPGMDDAAVPSAFDVFRMATEGGAQTTPFGSRIGVLEVGRAADIVLFDWQKVSEPFIDPRVSLIDALVQRATTRSVDTVMVAGKVVLAEGRFTQVDRQAVFDELARHLNAPATADEQERRELSEAVLPVLRRFYDGYCNDCAGRGGFYRDAEESR